jgi:glycosyltransferase involved in cell wall biosynthesis
LFRSGSRRLSPASGENPLAKHVPFPDAWRTVQFSIITPSYRNSSWLKLCIASVADQGVAVEHIIQDAGSDDGTLDWLPSDPRVKAFVEKDAGMYDAVNRGLRRASGDILAYLNCDEQYLPGALHAVEKYFQDNPTVDMVFGDVIMVDANGNYLHHRKMQTPLLQHTWTCHLSTLSCAMFFRRRLILELNLFFDPQWRDAGDGEWMVRVLRRKIRMGTLGDFTSVFTQTGTNMSAGPNAHRENRRLRETAPVWARSARPLIILHHRLRRWLAGMYQQEPFTFEIYTATNPQKRIPHFVSSPVSRQNS